MKRTIRLMWPVVALVVLLTSSSMPVEAWTSRTINIRTPCGTQQEPIHRLLPHLDSRLVTLLFDRLGDGTVSFRVEISGQQWEAHTVGNRRGPTKLTVYVDPPAPHIPTQLMVVFTGAPCPAPDLVAKDFVITWNPYNP